MTKLTLKTSKFFGVTYYSVDVYLDSRSLTHYYDTWVCIEKWCQTAYGKPGDAWDKIPARWYGGDGVYHFKFEKDRTAFILRWSNEAVA